MQQAKENDYVTVTYEGFLSNGDLFESSKDSGPLQFQIGTNSVFPGFEQGVLGMEVNETKKITLQPEEAYGPRKEELVLTVPRQNFGDMEITKGMVVGMTVEQDGTNHKVPALVTEINNDDTVTVDFNHPLAGQQLTFAITLQSIDLQKRADNCGCGCAQTPDSSCSPEGGCSGCN